MRIAQRFNAGLRRDKGTSPVRDDRTGLVPNVLSPLRGLVPSVREPSVETLGYYRMSLRDNGISKRH